MPNNKTKIAKIISYLFVPPVTNLFIFIIFSINYETEINQLYAILISFFFGFLIPVLTFIHFRKKGLIVNDDATIKEERTIPYIYAIFFSLIGVSLNSILGFDERLSMLWMVYLITSLLIININRFWKISAHAMGASMPVGALAYLGNEKLVIISLVILILVIISRLILKVHTILQVLAGSISGFFVSYFMLKYCL